MAAGANTPVMWSLPLGSRVCWMLELSWPAPVDVTHMRTRCSSPLNPVYKLLPHAQMFAFEVVLEPVPWAIVTITGSFLKYSFQLL